MINGFSLPSKVLVKCIFCIVTWILIFNVEKICVWSWPIGNRGFHLIKVVFISINVELLTPKVCFIFQNYCWPLCCGERHLFVTFCNQQEVKGLFTFALISCWWLWKTMSFVFSTQWLTSSWNLLATVKSFPTQLVVFVNACMLSTWAWNLSWMLGYQDLTNAWWPEEALYRMHCGWVVRAPDLKSGDPEFDSCPDHQLDLFQVVPGSTPRLRL